MKYFHLKTLLTALLLLCSTVASAHNFEVNGIYYNILSSTDKTVEVTFKGSSYSQYPNEYSGAVTIPASVTYGGTTYSVTSIGHYAFSGCTSLKNVTIPNSVTTIEYQAFYNCTSLASASIGDGITMIGHYAFSGCTSLTSVTIPNCTTTIESNAFSGCTSLKSASIGNSVTTIGSNAFSGSGLTSITIPNSVTTIGNNAFSGCTNLKTVINNSNLTLTKGSSNYGYVACYANKVINAPNGSVEGDFVFGIINRVNTLCGYLGNDTSIVLPQNYKGENYKIGENAFAYCSSLTSVTIPNSVTSIGSSAFYECSSLTSVTIPNSVTTIGSNAFYNSSSLKTVINLSSLTLTKGSRNYGYVAYYADKVINAPSGSIEGDFAFGVIDGVNTLVAYLGTDSEVTLPNSYKGEGYVIGSDVFKNNTIITSITIPDTVTSIGSSAFSGCSGLISVTIPNSVTNIGNYAFKDCTGLTSIVIPNSVTTIGEDAFYKCSSLKEVHITDIAAWCNIDFINSFSNPLDYANNLYLNGELVTNLVIPDSVTEIKNYAFTVCNITSASISNSVTTIGGGAFSGCSSLTSIEIPNSVTTIGNDAFSGCSSLTSITIPNSVTTIGSKAFRGCTNLTSITIPKSVIKIEKSAFNYCENLASIIVDYRNMTYDSRGNCNAIIETRTNTLIAGCKNTVIPNSVTTIGEWAFGCCNSIENIEIPNNVTTIGENAFNSCSNLKSVTIPNSVTTIGNYAFSGSGLTSITIPNSITTIGDGAFSFCRSLESVTIPNSVTTIGQFAFAYCDSLKSVTIPNSVTTIGNYAFDNCTSLKVVYIEAKTPPTIGYYTFPFIETLFVPIGATDAYLSWGFWEIVEGGSCGDNATWTLRDNTLTISGIGDMYDYTFSRTPWDSYKFQITEIVINNGITTIGERAFYECSSLTSVTIPNSVTTIGNSAFSGCSSLASVTIPNSVINIEYGAFNNCTNLANIEIPNSITTIGDVAFSGCSSLASVTIPNSVTTIGDGAFSSCRSLESVTIPNSVTSIGHNAFGGCDNLTSIKAESGNTKYDSRENCNAIIETETNTLIAGCKNTVIPNSVTTIGERAFINCSSLTSITIPNCVTTIGDGAFYNCSSLTSVTIPNSVTTIGNYAFQYCSNLTSITIPNSVTTIGEYAFEYCSRLTSVIIGNSVTTIGSNAFSGCAGLTSVTIPNSVTTIGESAFSGCSSLASVTIPNSVTTIGYDAFRECWDLKEVHITDIAAWYNIDFNSNSSNPLYYANNLYLNGELVTELVIPDSVTEIKSYAFSGCSSLASVTIPNSVTTIGDGAFSGCSSLASVTIPNSVTTIGNGAFYDCTSLKEVHITNIAAWCNIDFKNNYYYEYNYSSNPLYYANNLYLNGELVTNLVIPDSITEIKQYAFYNCSSLTSVTIPNSVTNIGEDAFRYCRNLKTVCNLSSLNIVTGNSDHGYIAYYANNIITLPGCTAEGDFIFDNKSTLVTYIGNDSEIVLPANYKGGNYSIGNNAFRDNTTITSVTIPASVTSIGEYAFSGCTGINDIYVQGTIPALIFNDSFEKVYEKSTLHVPAGTKAAYTASTSQREVPTININDLQGTIKSCNTNASYTTVNVATQNPDVTGILYGSDYLLAYTNEKNASKLPSATFSITDTKKGRYKIALVTAPWFIESYEDTIVTSTTAPKYRKSYLRVSVSQNNELKGMFPSDSVKLRSGGYGVLATSAIVPDSASIDTIFLKDTNGEDFIFDLDYSGFIYDTYLSNSINVKVELLAPAYKRSNAYMAMNNNHYAHRFLLDQIMLIPVDKEIYSTVHWSNFANIVEMDFAITGDINDDDKVNVGDVTSIVSMILDPSAATDAADINGDGKVNVGDVTSLVSIILGTSNNAPARAAATSESDAPVVSAEFDADNNMYINVSNPDYPFTAIQFDLTIEGGISIVNDGEYYDVFLGSRTSSRNHSQPECAVQPDGSLRVVILSLKNKLFEGTEGDVATISLDATGVADGEYKYTIKNIVLSDPASQIKYLADVEGWTTVTDGVTVINSIAADGENANEAIYDLSGRKVANPVKGGIYIKGGKKFIM